MQIHKVAVLFPDVVFKPLRSIPSLVCLMQMLSFAKAPFSWGTITKRVQFQQTPATMGVLFYNITSMAGLRG